MNSPVLKQAENPREHGLKPVDSSGLTARNRLAHILKSMEVGVLCRDKASERGSIPALRANRVLRSWSFVLPA